LSGHKAEKIILNFDNSFVLLKKIREIRCDRRREEGESGSADGTGKCVGDKDRKPGGGVTGGKKEAEQSGESDAPGPAFVFALVKPRPPFRGLQCGTRGKRLPSGYLAWGMHAMENLARRGWSQ
jgi:hypothetical protein